MLISGAQRRCPSFPLLRPLIRHEHGGSQTSTGSAKLFVDAAAEEETEVQTDKSGKKTAVNQYPNWTGEESVQDVVLRMLVDKYKHARGVSIGTADDRLKSKPPSLRPAASVPIAPLNSPEESMSRNSNTGSAETHKPWLTKFHAPSHVTSIRHMRLPLSPPGVRPQGPPIHLDDSRARVEEKERRKKAIHAGRVTNARESSLDYRLRKPAATTGSVNLNRLNPMNVKGWANLVEERIEAARKQGHFRDIKGRGKPIIRNHEESNPFIPREEFLLKRIIQRQGAAPPWVEVQGELDAAIASFRRILQSTWTRRAVRILTLECPPANLSMLSLAEVTGSHMRDPEWEAREANYHEEAIRELNALVRKYNGVAPYPVRRSLFTRQVELNRIYEVSGGDILAEIRRRVEKTSPQRVTGTVENDVGLVLGKRDAEGLEPFRFSVLVKDMWNKLIAKFVGR